MAGSKERFFSKKWHSSTKKSLHLCKVHGPRTSLQKMTDELDSACGEIHQLQQKNGSNLAKYCGFLTLTLGNGVQHENETLRKRVSLCE